MSVSGEREMVLYSTLEVNRLGQMNIDDSDGEFPPSRSVTNHSDRLNRPDLGRTFCHAKAETSQAQRPARAK